MLAGEKLKESKKKAKMASASSSSQRDWGKVGAEWWLPDSEAHMVPATYFSNYWFILLALFELMVIIRT